MLLADHKNSKDPLILESIPADFYSKSVLKLLPLLNSAEHQTHDFKEALKILNTDCALGLDIIDIQVLSDLFSVLCQSNRFRADLRIHERLGENTATHSVMATILANALISESGVLADQKHVLEINSLRREISLGLLLHDMGEILGEFNSVAQRARNSSLIENAALEREIVEVAFRLALYAAKDGCSSNFREFMGKLREKCKIGTNKAISNEDLSALLSKIKSEIDELPGAYKSKFNKYLKLFDVAELGEIARTNINDRFIGSAIKVIEHLQGQRHLLRFAYTDSSMLPRARAFILQTDTSTKEAENLRNGEYLRLTTYKVRDSNYVTRVLHYTESNLFDLFQSANTPYKLTLAKTIRNATYTTIAEDLLTAPLLIDRHSNSSNIELQNLVAIITDPESKELNIKLAKADYERLIKNEQLELLAKHKKERIKIHDPSHTLMDIETSSRLANLYLTAVVRDYIPTEDKPLALLSFLPSELKPLSPISAEKSLHARGIMMVNLPYNSLRIKQN